MSPSHDALIEQLLSCRSQAERLALLEKTSPRPDPVLFVSTLKEQSDFLLYNNLTQAKEIAIAALDVAKFSQDAKAQAIASWADGNILFYQGNYSACLVRYEQTIAYYSSNLEMMPRLAKHCCVYTSIVPVSFRRWANMLRL